MYSDFDGYKADHIYSKRNEWLTAKMQDREERLLKKPLLKFDKDLKSPKDLAEIYDRMLFSNRGRTITVNLTKQNVNWGSSRSFYDIFRVARYYIPNIRYAKVVSDLIYIKSQFPDPVLYFNYCITIYKPVCHSSTNFSKVVHIRRYLNDQNRNIAIKTV